MENRNGVFSGNAQENEQYGQPLPTGQPPPMTQPVQNDYVQPAAPLKPEKKHGIADKIFGGVVLSIVIMGLYIGVQFAVAIVMMIGTAFQYAIESSGDIAYVTRMLTETIQEGEFMTDITVIATAVSLVFAVFFYWLIWGRNKTQQDKQYFRENVLRGKVFLMISAAAIGLYFLAVLIANIIGLIDPDMMEEYNKMMETALGGNVFMAMLAAVLLAPIAEECVMRGLIFKNLQKYFSIPAAIVIQAVIFGILHMNWVQGIYVLPVGLALGFLAAKSKSVLPCIYMHMLNNFMSLVLAVLPEFCQTNLFCIAAAAVCLMLVWLMYRQDYGKFTQEKL